MATADTESTRGPDQETEKITLSTIHQAKGLEWRAVFVIWLDRWNVPKFAFL